MMFKLTHLGPRMDKLNDGYCSNDFKSAGLALGDSRSRRSFVGLLGMKLVIRDDVDKLATFTAGEIVKTINVAKNAGRNCVLGLPVGNTMCAAASSMEVLLAFGSPVAPLVWESA